MRLKSVGEKTKIHMLKGMGLAPPSLHTCTYEKQVYPRFSHLFNLFGNVRLPCHTIAHFMNNLSV